MSKPKYNAYKGEILMTDGVQTWTRHEFDHTKVPNNDDWAIFKQCLSAPHMHPQGRIDLMRARLEALENITPTMQLHIDAIRKIHVDFLAKNPPTLESMDALEKQNEHWLKIQLISKVLPLARKKVKANTDARIASQKKRKKDPMRAAIIEAMSPYKCDYQTFKDFMRRWEIDHIGGLTITTTTDAKKFVVNDENGNLGEKVYSKRSSNPRLVSRI